ncbi:hypothetical protein [Methanosarcina acetivorans]|uniref:hypothetical protein n=1 Tax=Methanosarcina acetivorans TaxID=2214 RepID=UPI001389CBEF|nr:hypothetical protein [Methanosarcina acetivorans]
MSRFPRSTEKHELSSRHLYTGHHLVSKQSIFQTYPRLVTPPVDDIIAFSIRLQWFIFIRLLNPHLTKS